MIILIILITTLQVDKNSIVNLELNIFLLQNNWLIKKIITRLIHNQPSISCSPAEKSFVSSNNSKAKYAIWTLIRFYFNQCSWAMLACMFISMHIITTEIVHWFLNTFKMCRWPISNRHRFILLMRESCCRTFFSLTPHTATVQD